MDVRRSIAFLKKSEIIARGTKAEMHHRRNSPDRLAMTSYGATPASWANAWGNESFCVSLANNVKITSRK